MEWTNEKITKFVQEIEIRPIIWDPSHADFKNKNKKHDASVELAHIFNCNNTEIIRKWKIILAQYRRERKKIFDSKTSGSGLLDVYKPKWFAFQYLNFLHGKDESDSINSNDTQFSSQDISVEPNEEATTQTQSDNQESIFTEQTPSSGSSFRAPKRGLKRSMLEDPRVAQAVAIMQNVSKSIENRKQDDEDIFAAAVASKLRKIKNEKIKILVQRDIDSLLYDAIMGTGKYDVTPMPSPYSHASSYPCLSPTAVSIEPSFDNSEDQSQIISWNNI